MAIPRFDIARTGTLALIGSALGFVLTAAPASAQCVGDCNNSDSVEINELITGVTIAQGSQDISVCPSFDCQGTGMVPINCLITGVNNALCGCEGCGSTPTPTPVGPPVIRLAQNSWSGSRVDVAVAALLLHEELGYRVEVVPVDEYAQWDSLANGGLHACLEVWPSGHAEDIAQYIDGARSVQNAGALGVVGKIGWYVPTYVVAEHPELATWEGFTDPANAARFRTASTGERGQFLAGDRTWVQYDADIVANLGLDFTVVFAGSEAALLAQVDAAYAGRQPILFYFWMPHAAHRRYDLTEVRLPPHSAACYARADFGGVDCDYPADVLFKIVWRGLPEYAPEAHDFITRFHWSTEQQTELLAAVDLEGMTPDDAARRWVATHEDVWREWLPH